MLTKLTVVIILNTVSQVIMVYMELMQCCRPKASKSIQCCDGIMYMVS